MNYLNVVPILMLEQKLPVAIRLHSTVHTAAKERNRRAIRFLIENGEFLPDNIEDTRVNLPVHCCPGLEWAYEEMKRVQQLLIETELGTYRICCSICTLG